jgi:putative DNA primase/helicase
MEGALCLGRDPARLMYVPRHAPDADPSKHEVHVIAGELLDADAMPKPEPKPKAEAKAKPAGTKADGAKPAGDGFKTPGLARFMAVAAKSFRAHACLKAIDPAGIRDDSYTEAEAKHNHQCPREDLHTEPDTADRAFFARDALPGGSGFGMSCRHNGCVAFATRPDGKEDRAAFLDLWCQERGVSVEDLLAYCDDEARAQWDTKRGFQADRPVLDRGDPMSTAREFLARHHTADGLPTLRRYRGEWFRYDGKRYAAMTDEAVKGELWCFLDRADRIDDEGELLPFKPSKAHVDNVVQALAAHVGLPDDLEAPAWIGGEDDERPPAGDMLACRNGLLHVPMCKLQSHTAEFFSFTALPYDFNEKAPEPEMWARFLSQIFAGDNESILCLQVWFGCLLLGDGRRQKIVMLKGPERSGKGLILKVIAAMLGHDNVVGTQIATLLGDFGLQSWIGKRAVRCGNVRLEKEAKTAKLVERLLSLSSGDVMSVPRKFAPDWVGRLPALITMAGNYALLLKDPSAATRFIVLATQQGFLGREDHDLERKLMAELSSILRWALHGAVLMRFGWDDLRQPALGAEAVEQSSGAAPVRLFASEKLTAVADATERKDDVYAAYCEWAEARREPPMTDAQFWKALREVVPGLDEDRESTGARKRLVTGVRLAAPKGFA